MQTKDLHSDEYHLVWGSGPGRGTFIIIREKDDASTLRYVCGEGMDTYQRFARAFAESQDKFNSLCEKERFTRD